jgi:type VI secretion system protein ImpG
MSFARLFGDELALLQEVGKDFAAANPTLAPLLADEGGDPDVRRLL